MFILGQVRLSKGYLCPTGIGKGLGQGPAELKAPAGARVEKTPPQIIFNNARTSIKLESALDLYKEAQKVQHTT